MRNVFRIVNLITLIGLLVLVCLFSEPQAVMAYVNDGTVFINEIHYDNSGDDVGQKVELTGPSGTDLSGWQLVLYNGGTGLVYDTINLTTIIPDTTSGYGQVVVETPGLLNDSPSGLALVKPDTSVAMFLSYEGSFTAADGPATGLTSTNIGVSETGADPEGYSLQLSGLGKTYADFTWQAAAQETFGAVNTGQYFGEVFINEINHINSFNSLNEGIEIVGPADYSLENWKILIYYKIDKKVRKTVLLSGFIPNQQDSFGTLNFLTGDLDSTFEGFALINAQNQVVQFLSYGGIIIAQDGLANGLRSENIGVVEYTSGDDLSLQLSGRGVKYTDFTWQPPAFHTRGLVNNNQNLGLAVNTAPTASGQTVTTNEDTSFSITLSAVDGEEDPLTYHLDQDVQHGTLTTDSANEWSYTPDTNFYGEDSFTFYANDGKANSSSATVTITVEAVNDAPFFTAGDDVTINEDAGVQTVSGWATGINPGAENESEQILTFGLTITSGSDLFSTGPTINATSGDLTFTPAADKNGTAVISVVLSDNGGVLRGGENTSISHELTIQINPVNDAPTFTAGDDVTVNEDAGAQTVTAWASDIDPGAPDENGQTLLFDLTFTSGSDLFTTAPAINSTTGDLTFTPAADKNGTAVLEVTLSDDGGVENNGANTRSSVNLTIQITAVNDQPCFTGGENITINEDAGPQTVPAWATDMFSGAEDESHQALTFHLLVTAGSDLFSAAPEIDASSGDLSFTPAADQFGEATISVTLSDDGGTLSGGVDTSVSHNLTIQINPINDAPDFIPGENVTINEDAGLVTIEDWATGFTAGNSLENGQELNFVISVTQGASLFSVTPAIDAATGNLSFTTSPDAFGLAEFDVYIQDDGGTAIGGLDVSESHTIQITINTVNDKPSFSAGSNLTVLEDSAAFIETNWAADISAGPDNESGQTLQFQLVVDQPGLFETQPVIQTNGTLTFTPAPQAFGTATVEVTLSDDGGTANGGENQSSIQTFEIEITPVNDAPVFTPGEAVMVDEDAGEVTIPAWATDIHAGKPNETGQALAFSLQATTGADLFDVLPEIDSSSGNLTFTPAENAFGTAEFSILLSDDGGTANGGVDQNMGHSLTITINSINDAPTALAQNLTLDEDGSLVFDLSATDVENDILLFEVIEQPTNGSLTQVDTSYHYTPDPNYFGSDSITFTASDSIDTSQAAVITFTVQPLNDAPEASPESYTVKAGETLTVSDPGVLENDMDVDGDALTSITSSSPAFGSLTLNTDGSFEYAAPNDYSGEVVFSYRASDGELFSEIVIVTITVEENDPITGNFFIFLPMTLR